MSLGAKEVLELLNNLNISFEIIEHKQIFTMEEALKLKLPNEDIVAKNLFLRDEKKENYYLITMPHTKKRTLQEIREKIISKRLTFASENDLNNILGLQKGSVTPTGILNDKDNKVQVIIDEIFANTSIGLHPNESTATIWLKTSDLVSLIKNHGNDVRLINL